MKRIFQSKKSSSFEGEENHDKDNDIETDRNNNNNATTTAAAATSTDAWKPNRSSVVNNEIDNDEEFGMISRAGKQRGINNNNNNNVVAAAPSAAVHERPNYRGIGSKSNNSKHNNNTEDDDDDEEPIHRNLPLDDDDDDDDDEDDDEDEDDFHSNKAEHIEKSAGTSRLNRILRDAATMSTTVTTTTTAVTSSTNTKHSMSNTTATTMSSLLFAGGGGGGDRTTATTTTTMEKVSNPRNIDEMGDFVGRVVIPPLRVDPTTIGGHMLDTYPLSMQQETLYVGTCGTFENTNTNINMATNTTTTTTANTTNPGATATTTTTTTTSDMIYMSTLQYPNEYNNRKRSLGLYSTTTMTTASNASSKYRNSKIRYIVIGRSTNRPLLKSTQQRQIAALRKKQHELVVQQQQQEELEENHHQYYNNSSDTMNTTQQQQSSLSKKQKGGGRNNNNKKMNDDSDRGDYDTMFAPDDDGAGLDDNDDDDDDEKDGESRNSTTSQQQQTNHPTNDPNTATAAKNNETNKSKSVKIAMDDNDDGDLGYNNSNNNEMVDTAIGSNKKKNAAMKLQMEEEEISSFPVLICMTLQHDGTGPDIRKLIPLDQLTTIQDLNSTIVQLAFTNGDTIRIDFGTGTTTTTNMNTTSGGGIDDHDTNPMSAMERKSGNNNTNNISMERSLDKERFVWSILQIHAMLCMSVVERNSRGTNFLLPLNVRNVDRAELQYIATINGFIAQNESVHKLLDRQRKLISDNEASTIMMAAANSSDAKNDDPDREIQSKHQKQQYEQLDMDEMAYDLMMGNFATRVTLFHSEDERKDAEEILNSPEWTELFNHCTLSNTKSDNDNDDDVHNNGNGTSTSTSVAALSSTSAALNVAERLTYILQSRMRDLEAETCRRLIAWEDEKHVSLSNKAKLHDASDSRDTVDALALASLFKTLESLDSELKAMEDWLQDRAAAIKPLTDDCADIEEENRQLEQQWKSYDMLGNEMKRLLHGQELDETTETILKNPASVLIYDEGGLVNVDESEDGIERLYDAGKALLDAIEFPRKCGGIHLKAVAERAKGLTSISNTFCSSLAQIIVTVMEQFKTEVVAGSDHGKVSKSDTHTVISKKIRDTQRKFQSALLSYIKLIEILAALAPDMLPALRDAYAELVAEGILMKKRMKGYFQALPGKNTACLNRVGKNIKDYVPFDDTIMEETVNAPDIRAVLSELLPVIAREAYFTSALFGSMNREQDGREKKRNFENAKNAVDKASVHFRYYLNRTCGVVDSHSNESGDAIQRGDPLLCLVATIYLNEIMDSYVDREKKGGDHSLSLAYVRATILDLRKKADKQWVSWVEQQIEWVKSNDGVPLTGKRAGIFPSFARFPVYLDHVMQCCKEGRDDDYFPDLSGIKVINYYLQKIAVTLLESLRDSARRETTDQSYASHVMQMENTYFFTQSVKERGEVISKLFSKQVTKANAICKESTDAYLGWMIKREFTALHELFSRVSKIRKELGDSDVVSHVPKTQFIKTLQKEANRDVLKEKIGAMYSRMEKHLSEEGQLLPIAWKALVKVLYEWFGRWEKLCTSIYKHKLDPSSVDVVRIAKAAGGGVVKSQGTVASEGTTEFGFKSILALGNKQSQKS